MQEIVASKPEVASLDPLSVRTGIERAHLETALAVHLHGSFGRAALALNMLPSTVNKRVRNLEFQLGCALFERQKRRLVATHAGSVFLRRSASLLRDFHALVDAVRRIADGKAGQVSIGYHGALAHEKLRSLLLEADPDFPEIYKLPVELPHDRLFEALASGRIDLAITHSVPDLFQGRSAPMWNERFVLCLPESHRLAGRAVLQWVDLLKETFLISAFDASEAMRDVLNERFAPFGVSPRVAVHEIGPAAIIQMVGVGKGVSLCLDSLSRKNDAGAVFRELNSTPGTEGLTINACWHTDHANPALDILLKRLFAFPRMTTCASGHSA